MGTFLLNFQEDIIIGAQHDAAGRSGSQRVGGRGRDPGEWGVFGAGAGRGQALKGAAGAGR